MFSDEGISGKTLDRPALTEALAFVASGEATGLAVSKLDRLSRSVAEAQAKREALTDGSLVAFCITTVRVEITQQHRRFNRNSRRVGLPIRTTTVPVAAPAPRRPKTPQPSYTVREVHLRRAKLKSITDRPN